jgi:thiol-disulfide isomerase/thioredoxin
MLDPEKRLIILSETFKTIRTLEAECTQIRRYLKPFSQIKEQGKLLLKHPDQFCYTGSLFLPTETGDWRKSRPAESRYSDGNTICTVRYEADGVTYERQKRGNTIPALTIDPLLGFFDSKNSHLSEIREARRKGNLLRLYGFYEKKEERNALIYVLRKPNEGITTVTLYFTSGNILLKVIRRTETGGVKSELETTLSKIRYNIPIATNQFRIPLPKEAKPYIPPKPPLKPGTDAPDITLDLINPVGKEKARFMLSENKGKLLLLDFWAPWCRPCIAGFPDLEKQAAQGLTVILIPLWDSPENVEYWVNANGLRYPHLQFARGGVASDAAGAAYRITQLPSAIRISPEGKITASNTEHDAKKEKKENI